MNNIGTQNIETNRLLLRKFEYSDADDMLTLWASKPEIQHMYSEPVYTTLEAVNGLLDKFISAYKNEHCYRWAIIDKTDKRCIGQIAYYLVDAKNHFAEIEYCLATEYQKRGYMTEAVRAVLDFGFNKIGLHRVQISTKEINAPSKRVIEKCGFKFEGKLRDFFFYNGEYVGRLYYSMLKDEFEMIKKDV